MRRLAVAASVSALVISGTLLVGSQGSPDSSAAALPNNVRSGTPLTNTTFGSYSQVDQIDMLSPTLGYALATGTVGKGRYRYFVVRTTDLARTWTVLSELPGDNDRFPIFSDYFLDDSDPSIYFANRQDGYVNVVGGSIYATDDGGLTWTSITPRNSSSSYAVNGSTTSVVTSTCSTPAGNAKPTCRYTLSEFALGSTRPRSVRPLTDRENIYQQDVGLLAAPSASVQIISLSVDQMSTASSLLITDNQGLSWTTLTNPCHGSMIEQMVVANNGEWILSCFLDEGMSHGTAQIFRSANRGLTWSTVVDDTALRNVVGNLGGGPDYLFFNGNDSVLYAAEMGPAGGLAVSTDGGTNWTAVRRLANNGGSPGSITNFGPTTSIYQVFQGPVYVTANSKTWTLLPQLPAGVHKGMSICTDHDTSVSWHDVTSGKLRYRYADFTNHSNASCYLDAAPNVQPVNARGKDVGPANATDLVSSNGPFVELPAHGGVAHVPFFIDPTSSVHPPSTCRATRVSAFRISFGPPSSFLLPTNSSVCRLLPSISVDGVSKGRGKP
jgi:photosystem II stability/assembly factor-like uncharacterized protein